MVIARRYSGNVTSRKLILYLCVGFSVGMILGYIIMGKSC